VCDGAFYQNKTVALIGGGNSALQEAILLSESCKKVYVIQNLDFLTGEKRLEEILRKRGNVEIITGTVVNSIADTPEFSGITVEKTATGEKTELALDGMFVAIGLVPENGAFSELCELDGAGYFASGEDCTTKTLGIFVAGDCRAKGVRQVATATADGAVAAIAACRYIDSL
jgi:thioredoxin reductase (NADPH)